MKKNFLWNKLKVSLIKLNIDYENLRNSNILITGGTGFVGSWIIHSLALINDLKKLKLKITIITSNPENKNKYSYLNKLVKISYQVEDINDIEPINYEYTHIIHGAAVYKGTKKDIYNVNVKGTKKMINLIRENNIKNIVFLSSGAVYEKKKSLKLTEKSKINSNTFNKTYESSKIQGERLLTNYFNQRKGINLNILRLFSFSGAGTSSLNYSAYSNFIESKFKGEDIFLKSNGLGVRSYMSSIDMACWIIKSLSFKKLNIFNLGSDKQIKIVEIAKKIAAIKVNKYKKLKVSVNSFNDFSYYVPNTGKAKKNNFRMQHNLNESIKDDLKHREISKNPHQYYFMNKKSD